MRITFREFLPRILYIGELRGRNYWNCLIGFLLNPSIQFVMGHQIKSRSIYIFLSLYFLIKFMVRFYIFCFKGQLHSLQMSNTGNWMHIRYQSKLQARKALSKDGRIFGESIMIGVKPCIDKVSYCWCKENGFICMKSTSLSIDIGSYVTLLHCAPFSYFVKYDDVIVLFSWEAKFLVMGL